MLLARMNGFHGPVFLELRPSAWLPRGIVAVHVVVLATLWLAYPPSLPRNLLCAAITLHGLWLVMRLLWVPPRLAVARLELSTRLTWRVVFRDGRDVEARLQRAALVSPLITTLSLHCADGARCEVLLLPDTVNADAFRRLRVRLRAIDGELGASAD
jgi:hypothetical protein